MRITKISKKACGALALAGALFIGVTPITAFAHTGPEAECICEEKCTEDNINPDCPVCNEDYTLCQGTEAEAEPEITEEPDNDGIAGPLTPDGNMTLVDDYGTLKAGGKQFITVVTKSGNYFYIIIDRDDQGNETVHFLNMVDEADLLKLMDEDEQKAYMESISDDDIQEPQEDKPEPEEEEVIEFLGAGGFMGYKYLKEKNPKKEAARPDPDEDYSEDDDEDYLDDEAEDFDMTDEEEAPVEDTSEEE